VPDHVIRYVLGAAVLACAWLALKALARRGRGEVAYRRLDPTVQALRIWVGAAPAVFTYIAIWTTTSVLQQGQPMLLADLAARVGSTNLFNLTEQPGRVLFTSAFLVADYGFGYWLYVAAFVLVAARLEHRVGAARWLLVAAGSHVLGTLLTVLVEAYLIKLDTAPRALAFTQDVGVSYVMVGSLGAYAWYITARWRWPFVAALSLGVVGPLIARHTIWDLGHFLATAVGVGLGWLTTRWPSRERVVWRSCRTRLSPRPLPTFDATTVRRAGEGGSPS
jgi:hypothetical protein